MLTCPSVPRTSRARSIPLAVLALIVASCDRSGPTQSSQPASASAVPEIVLDVRPGEDIQAAIERAASTGPGRKLVRVHEGTYRPRQPAQALIWFHARHDGITVEAVGPVVLTAANESLAQSGDASYPAVVNHVVYFGDGVGPSTVLRGFEITGANHFVTKSDTPGPIQPFVPVSQLEKTRFFYCDGGAIKVYGRSYPTLEKLNLHDNYASPCAGGLSIEQHGFNKKGEVTVRDCVFRDNRCQVTGSAIDLLPGSAARIENCLFAGNVSNLGIDDVSPSNDLYNAEHGSGALTVFKGSVVHVVRCTFTDNWNGVDDRGEGNEYRDCIFWRNTRSGGICPGSRYEIDILDASAVRGCKLCCDGADLRGTLDAQANQLGAPDPGFDAHFEPRAKAYAEVGYRAARATRH